MYNFDILIIRREACNNSLLDIKCLNLLNLIVIIILIILQVLIKITDSLYFKGKYVYVKLDKNGEINIHQIILAILHSKDTRYETPQSRIKLKRNII